MKRRNFFRLVGIGWFVTALPNAITACSSQTGKFLSTSQASPLPDLPKRADGFVAVGTVSTLDQTGFLKTQIAGKPALIVRDPAHKNTLRAVSRTCTHAGCLVDWNADDKKLECPCHDSQFALDGRVLQGPAEQALPTYAAKLENNDILLKFS
jgi:cytochrome b6-f complex iron-sulfur subunit